MAMDVTVASKPVVNRALERILIGGIGAIAPVLLSLMVIDLKTLLLSLTAVTVISYLLRAIVLFAVGALVAWLHKSERDQFKLFQLGMAAPALVLTGLNGSNVSLPESPSAANQASWSIISPAYAQMRPDIKMFSYPRESPAQQAYRGFLGKVSPNLYFVVAGSHQSRNAAETQARELRSRGLSASVYAGFADDENYQVVIGEQLTLPEAQEVQQHAASAQGIETHLWTFPTK